MPCFPEGQVHSEKMAIPLLEMEGGHMIDPLRGLSISASINHNVLSQP